MIAAVGERDLLRSRSTTEDQYIVDAGVHLPDIAAVGATGHSLARMVLAGLPVPATAILGTQVYRRHAERVGDGRLRALNSVAVAGLEQRRGLRLGGTCRPLVLSVRAGEPGAVPALLDTVPYVGLCEENIEGLISLTEDPCLAWDCYRRLIESFACIVAHCPTRPFEEATQARLAAVDVRCARDLDTHGLAELTGEHLDRFDALAGETFPQNPHDEVQAAVCGVLEGSDVPAGADARPVDLPDTRGTAVILQRMTIGGAGISGSGVGFTRNPATAEPRSYVEILFGAPGDGIDLQRDAHDGAVQFPLFGPDTHDRLTAVCQRLEAEFDDAQEFHFTVADGQLFVLDTRSARRAFWAALQIAVDQARDGSLSRRRARERLAGFDLQSIRRDRAGANGPAPALSQGQPAGPGIGSGAIVLDVGAIGGLAHEGRPAVLVAISPTAEDLAALDSVAGLVIATGGGMSPPAVANRAAAVPGVVSAAGVTVDLRLRRATIGGREFMEGDEITLDGDSGRVFAGTVSVDEKRLTANLATVAAWPTGDEPG